MQWISLMLFILVGPLMATPVELHDQRSQPMGAVRKAQHSRQQAVPQRPLSTFFVENMQPRFQWFSNRGYCGEVALISAGLKYGQYISQYTARETLGSGQSNTQVLLGLNDHIAADNMHLKFERWKRQDTPAFLTWIKAYILNGYPVILGVYSNQCLFYGLCKKPSSQGDEEYDHIVPVLGILSSEPVTSLPPLPPAPLPPYLETDSIVFSDNGLQGPVNNPVNPPCLPNPANPYEFTYSFKQFQANRSQANTNNQWYSLSTDTSTYGIAILGIRDDDHNTIPVTVETHFASQCTGSSLENLYANYEYPSIVDLENTRPSPMPLSLKVTVAIPDVTQEYKLYRYDSLEVIPNSQFNGHASQAAKIWTISPGSGTSVVIIENILSDEVAAYRAVPSNAP